MPHKRVSWKKSLNKGHRNLKNFILTVNLVLFSVFLAFRFTIAFLFAATAWPFSAVHLTAVK